MRIGIVGGVERNQRAYREVAARWGHQLSFHPGHVGGRGSGAIIEMASSVGLLIVTTDVNSHGAVILARRVAQKHGTPLLLQRRCSPSRLAAICAGLETPATAAAP